MFHYFILGDLKVYNRIEKHSPGSILTHANDLVEILREERQRKPDAKCVLLKTDQGCDWSMKSLMTFYYLGRIWKDENLDVLVQTSYKPGHSRFNMVEHLWARLSAALAGVTLPAPDEDAEEEADKEACNFSLKCLDQHWNRLPGVQSKAVDCFDVPSPYDDKDEIYRILTKAGVREHQKDEKCKEVREFLEFLAEHSIVRHNQMEFYKHPVAAASMCNHCRENPPTSDVFYNLLEMSGGHIASPTPSDLMPGHYMTALDIYGSNSVGYRNPETVNAQLSGIDEELKKKNLIHQLCPYCTHFELRSKTAAERHMILFHMSERQRGIREKRKAKSQQQGWVCTTCKYQASSKHALSRHKKESGHVRVYKKRKTNDVDSDEMEMDEQ